MAQNVLNHHGNIVPCRTLRCLTTAEPHSPVEIKKRDAFDARIKSILGDSISLPPAKPPVPDLDLEDFSDINDP